MMNRRTFMCWLGLAPVAAVTAVTLPKLIKLARPNKHFEQLYGWEGVTTGRWHKYQYKDDGSWADHQVKTAKQDFGGDAERYLARRNNRVFIRKITANRITFI